MTIMVRDLPIEERPREKLLAFGSETLSNTELLAILLRTGTKEASVMRVAEAVLARCKDLGVSEITKLSPKELSDIKGVGRAKAATILAAIEFGRRVEKSPPYNFRVRTAEDVFKYARPYFNLKNREHFAIVMLTVKNDVIAMKEISVGNLTSSIVHPREVFFHAIRNSAASIIALHNHPSGDPTPSKDDYDITRRLVEAGRIIGIDVLDHIVLAGDKYFSMQEEGIIPAH